MASLAGFNAAEVPPSQPFDLIPPGYQVAAIIQSDIKPTKAGTGEYLELVWQILEGEYAGRKLFDRLNINNPNAVAQKIGQESLSAICHAVGILQPNSTEDLHDVPVLVKVGVKSPRDGYDAANEIKGYKPFDGAAPPPQPKSAPAASATPAAAATAQPKAAPWRR